jgi:hypothetical protein
VEELVPLLRKEYPPEPWIVIAELIVSTEATPLVVWMTLNADDSERLLADKSNLPPLRVKAPAPVSNVIPARKRLVSTVIAVFKLLLKVAISEFAVVALPAAAPPDQFVVVVHVPFVLPPHVALTA